MDFDETHPFVFWIEEINKRNDFTLKSQDYVDHFLQSIVKIARLLLNALLQQNR